MTAPAEGAARGSSVGNRSTSYLLRWFRTMAEPAASSEGKPVLTEFFPEEHVVPPVFYRRVSGFAIASLIVSVFFGLWVAISALVGFRSRSPVLLPIYVQMLPVAGAVLALIAMLLIRRSEGTLAGARLATWALLLCAVFGLGYWAYYGATDIAVCNQAEAFTREWFKKITAGDYAAAFLDTQDPGVRQKVNPNDKETIRKRFLNALGAAKDGNMRGPLWSFKEMDLVHLLMQGGDRSQIKTRGVREWDYKAEGYRVKQAFQITTDEGSFEVQVTVHGIESKTREFEGRAWYVVSGSETGVLKDGWHISELGQNLAELRRQSARFIDQWSTKLARGQLTSAYRDTLEPAEAKRLEKEIQMRFTAAHLSSSGMPLLSILNTDLGLQAWGRAFSARRFEETNLVHGKDKYDFDDKATKDAIDKAVLNMFGASVPGAPVYVGLKLQLESIHEPWHSENQRLRLPHDCKLGFMVPPTREGGRPQAQYQVDAVVVAESDAGPIDPARQPSWRLVRIDLVEAMNVDRMKMGPGMPSIPRGFEPGGPSPDFAKPPPLKR
jgi:hypothetical protein